MNKHASALAHRRGSQYRSLQDEDDGRATSDMKNRPIVISSDDENGSDRDSSILSSNSRADLRRKTHGDKRSYSSSVDDDGDQDSGMAGEDDFSKSRLRRDKIRQKRDSILLKDDARIEARVTNAIQLNMSQVTVGGNESPNEQFKKG